jgi:hypothetical protein
MIHPTTKGLILNPAPPVDEVFGDRAHEELSRGSAALGDPDQRLRQLDREWDVDRLTAATSGLLLLLGLRREPGQPAGAERSRPGCRKR